MCNVVADGGRNFNTPRENIVVLVGGQLFNNKLPTM